MTLIMQSKLLLAHGFAHGFSTRLGGVSEPPFDALNLGRNLGDAPQAVETNHARLAEAIGYDLARLAEADIPQIGESIASMALDYARPPKFESLMMPAPPSA